MNRYYTGILLIVISAACFALMPIFAVFAYQGNASIATVLFLRFALAALLLFAYLAWKKKSWLINRRALFNLVLMGGVLYTLQSSLYFASVKYIAVSLQALLFYTYPIFVAVLATLVYKEKFSRNLLLSISISLLGMALVIGTSFDSINLWGASLALGAAAVYSLYINLGNRLIQNIPPDLATAYISLFAAISFLLAGTFSDSLRFDFQPSAWGPIIGIAFFSTTVAIFAFFRGLELLGSTRSAIISIIEPVITITISSLLFHDQLSSLQWVGGVLVLAGAYIVVKSRPEQNPDKIKCLDEAS